MTRSLLAISLLALSPIGASAVAQSAGPFMACPLYLAPGPNTLGPASTVLETNEIYYKRAGFFDLHAAVSPAMSTRPDFSMNAMFGMVRPPAFRFDAISSGNCTVFASYDSAGDPVLDLGSADWGALLFSVDRNSGGGTTAAVNAEATAPEGAGADLFSLVLPGSTLPLPLHCVPIGEAQRAANSDEMGFRSAPGQRPEMLDFDPYFTFYRCADPIPSYLNPNPWVYFSIPQHIATSTSPAMMAYLAPWFVGAGLPSGGTILRMQWQSTAPTPQWTTPQVFLSRLQLGLQPGDDIDALSVDEGSGRVLLSLRYRSSSMTPLEDQLMVASFVIGAGGATVTVTAKHYYYDDGTDTKQPMGEIAGAETGSEIDASCMIDPSTVNGPGDVVFGYIVACRGDTPYPVTMSASAFATAGGGGVRRHAISVSGLPLGGVAGVLIGFPGPGMGPVINGAGLLFLSTPTTRTYEWAAPATPAALGWSIDFQWAALSGSSITLASTVRIRI